MSWLTIVWSMCAGACGILGFTHLAVWLQDRTRPVYLLSALTAFAALANSLLELRIMHAVEPAAAARAMRLENVVVAVMVVSLAWFLHIYFGPARRWLALSISALWGVAVVANLLSPASLVFTEITGLDSRIAPWGEPFSIPSGPRNPWVVLAEAASLILIAYAIDASVRAWRSRMGPRAVATAGAIAAFIVVAGIHAPLVDAGVVAMPYMVSPAFLAIVLTLSCQLAADAFLAARYGRELKELRRNTEHLMRINAMGELASALAHELNQPLAAILSNAQAARRLLNNRATDLGEIREILNDIVRDDKRAGEIIHGLRNMLKRDTSEVEILDMREVIGVVSTMLQGEALRRGAAIRIEGGRGDPRVRAGRGEIQQVVLNLALNALEALDDQPPDSRQVSISTAAEGGRVTTAVRDSGPGIPPEALGTLFEPFRTSKPGGLGLGLSICRRIVESYGGRIEARSNEGGGATFGFTLPQAEDSPEPRRA